MTGPANPVPDSSDFVEIDPSGRYGRYNEILGKGASKTVYKAFDEYEGIEVAWNQVKLYDFLQGPEDLERLYCEIHLLKTLKHENIMKFYTSWVDTANRNINFVTEMFTSGTLRQYRLKHKRVNVRAVKHWCRQILKGLLYLHSLNPPVIHRDLKCDNIFINGNTGEVKIGDLGLAAILKKSYAAHCVGTPEFMAPEVYEEEYNELVDIYSFGMCLLEMATLEYPYSECNHPAQIYKKVVTGKKPEALYKVEDAEVREFIEKCLASVSSRLSAKELLKDPFLRIDDYGPDFRSLEYRVDSSISNSTNDLENEVDYHQFEIHPSEFDLFSCQEDEHLENVDISIKGKRREDDGVFLRLRIADEEGRIRNIYFPFDIENDTALSVAAEMVSELDITDQDVVKIAEMIDSEIATLVPEWKIGREKDEISKNLNSGFCNNSDNPSVENLQAHGRFEDITYKVNGQEQKNHEVYTDIWAQREAREEPKEMIQCDQAHDKEEGVIDIDSDNSLCESNKRRNNMSSRSVGFAHWDDYENEIRQELRWLKSKYQMQLRQLKGQKTDPKTKRGFYKPSLKSLLSLHRATSLPVDALDV